MKEGESGVSTPSGQRTETLPRSGGPFVEVRRFRLHVEEGPDRGATFRSAGERTTIGAHRSADVRLGDTAVSRFHCEIRVDDTELRVRDLGSRNGTSIDGVSVDRARLHDGARIALGRTVLRLESGQETIALPVSPRERFGALLGRSLVMRRVFAVLERAAASNASILFEGESGTGKDLAAHEVHAASERRDGPFVIVDCGAIPSELFEAELFGHERGAFTGAHAARTGAFEAACGGTLFLDEIGELAPELQPKLLRAVEAGEILRVGGSAPTRVDVRVLSATNRDLRAEVTAGRFRPDLYYRLAVLTVELPPLRVRPDDLPLVVESLLDTLGASDEARAWLSAPKVLAELQRHPWPGNIRELRNYLERSLALRTAPPVDPPDEQLGGTPVLDVSQPLRQARTRWIQHFERRYLEEILRAHGGNVTRAARAAGVDRAHFHRLLARAR